VTYYDVLDVSLGATLQDITKAYRAAAQVNHPDRGGSHAAMKQVNEAYAALRHPERRAAYDASLLDQTMAPQECSVPTPPASKGRPSAPKSRRRPISRREKLLYFYWVMVPLVMVTLYGVADVSGVPLFLSRSFWFLSLALAAGIVLARTVRQAVLS